MDTVVIKDGGSLRCRLRRTTLENAEGVVCDSTQQNQEPHTEVNQPVWCLLLNAWRREVRLLSFVLFIVLLCLLSFSMSAPHWFCCVLPLIKTEAHHLIWPVNMHPMTRPPKTPTDWTLKLIWIFFLSCQQTSAPSPFRTWLRYTHVCIATLLHHHTSTFFKYDFFLSFLRSVSWNIQKINSSLKIAQSSVPNPLQSLLVMIYSTSTKDISRTPEYIFWQSFDVTFRTSSERKAKTETLLTKILIFLRNDPISYADRFKYLTLVWRLLVLFWAFPLLSHVFMCITSFCYFF